MFAILERERALVRSNTQHAAERATEQAKSVVLHAFACRDDQLRAIETVTENFVRLGYHLRDGTWQRPFGSFKSQAAYVRQLAREMKRPYVKVVASSGQFSVSVPNARCYDILVARLALLVGVKDDICQIVRGSETTRMTFWAARQGPWSVERSAEFGLRCREHSSWWMEQAATNPSWRRALRLDT